MSATAIASTRQEELERALDNWERIHLDWVESVNRPNPDATYWDGVVNLIDVFRNGDMPDSMRELADRVEDLYEELDDYDHRENIDKVMPDDSYWAATQAVLDARKQRQVAARPKRIESIKELNDQKVPLWQIAKIYGFFDPLNGEPDTRPVQQEIDKPGSVITKDWIHPDERKRREEESSRRERLATLGPRTARKVRQAKPVSPESCRDLWEQKVSAAQAAKMLDRPEDDIAAEYADFEAQEIAEKAASNEDGSKDAKSGKSPAKA